MARPQPWRAMMPDTAFMVVCALLVGLCVGSFGSGIMRFAHEPSPKLPATAR